jgi:hypothetical protein
MNILKLYVTPGPPASSRRYPFYSIWTLCPLFDLNSLVRSSIMPRSLPLLSPSVLPLPLVLLLMQLPIIPVGAQVQAPACLPAAMGVWNWVRLLSSVHKER